MLSARSKAYRLAFVRSIAHTILVIVVNPDLPDRACTSRRGRAHVPVHGKDHFDAPPCQGLADRLAQARPSSGDDRYFSVQSPHSVLRQVEWSCQRFSSCTFDFTMRTEVS